MPDLLKKFASGPFSRLLSGISWKRSSLILLCGVLGGVAESALLIAIVQVASIALGGANEGIAIGPLSVTTTVAIVIGLSAGVFTILFQVLGSWITTRTAKERLVARRMQLVDHYLASDLVRLSGTSVGKVQEVFSQQIVKGSEGLVLAGSTAAALSNLVVLLGAAVFVSPLVALVLLGLGGLFGLTLRPLSMAVRRNSNQMVSSALRLIEYVSVVLRTPVEVRGYGAKQAVMSETSARLDAVARPWARTRLLQQASPIVFRASVLSVALLLVGLVSVWFSGAIIAVATIALLLVRALAYLQTVQNNRHQLEELSVYWESATSMLDSFPKDKTRWGSRTVDQIREVALTGVGFSYDQSREHLSIRGMTLRRGDLVSIRGASGGGKSTLVKLLLRLTAPDRGEITVNGQPAETYSATSWSENVAYLPQDVRLVPGTIRDNILFYREASDDEVARAVGDAALTLDIDTFPSGLDSRVSEDSANISGGQRQRIGLARALLNDPQLLILDEPTSALDLEAESEFTKTLHASRDRRITVVVTHRTAISNVSNVLVEVANGVASFDREEF